MTDLRTRVLGLLRPYVGTELRSRLADNIVTAAGIVHAAELEQLDRANAKLALDFAAVSAERDSLRGVVQAVEALVTNAECRIGWLSHSGADHRVKAVPAHLLRAALAAAADAPQPEAPPTFRFGDLKAGPGGCCGRPVGCRIDSQGCVHKVEKRAWLASVTALPRCQTCGFAEAHSDHIVGRCEFVPCPSPAVLPETPTCEHGKTEAHWQALAGVTPSRKTRQERWCDGPAEEAAES